MPDTGAPFDRRPHELGLIAELRLAAAFLTRLPVRLGTESGAPLASSVRAFPLVGLAIGSIAASILLAATQLGLPGTPAVLLALASGAVLTGALHEDGLADSADALSADDPERRLEIMRDSRIGAYGALALILVVALKTAALAQLAPLAAAAALAVAAVLSRAAIAVAMHAVAPARSSGLGASAGAPTRARLLQALAIAIALTFILAVAPGWRAIPATIAALALALAAMIRLMRRGFGGQTGDTLGATQQVCETAILLAIAAAAGW